ARGTTRSRARWPRRAPGTAPRPSPGTTGSRRSRAPPRPAQEDVGHGEAAGTVDGVHADQAGSRGRDAPHLFLRVAVVVEARDAVDRDAGTVDGRADLAGTIEGTAVLEDAPRGTRAAHVRAHGIAAVRLPVAQQAVGVVQAELVVHLAAVRREA